MTLYLNSVIPFGKYKGKLVIDVPESYREWLRENTNHQLISCNFPEQEIYTDEEKIRLYFSRLEERYKITCVKIGRKLIYNNVLIPF